MLMALVPQCNSAARGGSACKRSAAVPPNGVCAVACRCVPRRRPRNCGSYVGVDALPNNCCAADKAGGKDSCDGKVIPTPDKDRGKDYNHSSFMDIIIAGPSHQCQSRTCTGVSLAFCVPMQSIQLASRPYLALYVL